MAQPYTSPVERGFIRIGRVAGVELRLHVIAVLGVVLFGLVTGHPLVGVGLFTILVVHEAGHALLARQVGLVVVEIDVSLVGGVCRCRGSTTPCAESVIAWGGLLAQLLFGLTALALRFAIAAIDETPAGDFIAAWCLPSFVLAVINLLPLPRLDGAKAWRVFRCKHA